ncbi:MAG: hypothetical protein ACFCVC_09765 [Acidimicrobiia bacterium]
MVLIGGSEQGIEAAEIHELDVRKSIDDPPRLPAESAGECVGLQALFEDLVEQVDRIEIRDEGVGHAHEHPDQTILARCHEPSLRGRSRRQFLRIGNRRR